MRILQIGFGNNPGGVEAFVMNYYRELVKEDIQFDFVCMYEKIAYEDEILRLGGRVFYLPNVKRNYPGYVRGLRKILTEEKYEVVHVNMLSAANIVPLRLAKEAGVKMVIAHSHSTNVVGVVRSLMDRWNRPKISRYANRKVACGRAAAEWFFGKDAVEKDEVFIINNAIDTEKYRFSPQARQRVRRERGWDGKFVVGHVGRFAPPKNHEAVAEIFGEIQKIVPDAQLCLIGDGYQLPEIRKKIEKAGLKEKVCFAGVRSDVEEYLSAMDVFLFPSFFEGVPFTLIEAQANGLPCVVSDTITRDAFLSEEQVRPVSLTADYGEWAQTVLSLKEWKRKSPEETSEAVNRAHFNIKLESARLKQLYQER